ncbi:hypothetical protein SAY87_021690 [Trapa incisa]|uniref:Uncharacterized protein n=1 Tax=Trapa incisa TaxID=236973 RepID=A0AAN7JTU5_9MYRT|nr:hypothetical protein SAY87_021690 [Trapa incisa]
MCFFLVCSDLVIGTFRGNRMIPEPRSSHQQFIIGVQDDPIRRKWLHEVHSGANPVSNSETRKMQSRAKLEKSQRYRYGG